MPEENSKHAPGASAEGLEVTPGSVNTLFAGLYDELHRMARARLRHQQPLTLLDTTALVHESWERFSKVAGVKPTDRHAFLAYASRTMRSVIIDLVRAKQTERRGVDLLRVTFNTAVMDTPLDCEEDVIRLSEALDQIGQVDPRAVQVVEMRYFAGMSETEIGSVLGITERTVRRDWDKARLLLRAVLTL